MSNFHLKFISNPSFISKYGSRYQMGGAFWFGLICQLGVSPFSQQLTGARGGWTTQKNDRRRPLPQQNGRRTAKTQQKEAEDSSISKGRDGKKISGEQLIPIPPTHLPWQSLCKYIYLCKFSYIILLLLNCIRGKWGKIMMKWNFKRDRYATILAIFNAFVDSSKTFQHRPWVLWRPPLCQVRCLPQFSRAHLL